MVNKNVLRKVYLEKRMALSESEYDKRNQLVIDNFLQSFTPKKFNSIHVFLPIASKKEVNTWPIINACRKINPDIRIYTTKTMKNGHLQHFLLEEDTRLRVSPWGIPEPDGYEPVQLDNVDVVLLPLIISDKKGNRIGYGMGYYDRFLRQVSASHKVGLTLSPSLDEISYIEEHDIPLTCCVGPYLTEFF
ncbi:MAG: 5-formyltetrahydrofolate cyclo-ligase [Cyclobacteriaceae bacterium]